MTRSWNIVMTRIVEHCGDMVMEHCDDKNYGAFDDKAMEHCDDKWHGAL